VLRGLSPIKAQYSRIGVKSTHLAGSGKITYLTELTDPVTSRHPTWGVGNHRTLENPSFGVDKVGAMDVKTGNLYSDQH